MYIALDYEYDGHVSVYVHIYIYSYIHNLYIYMHTHHSRSHKLATNHLLYHRFLFTLRTGQGHRFFIAERAAAGAAREDPGITRFAIENGHVL